MKIYSSKNGENLMKLKTHKYKYLVGTPNSKKSEF